MKRLFKYLLTIILVLFIGVAVYSEEEQDTKKPINIKIRIKRKKGSKKTRNIRIIIKKENRKKSVEKKKKKYLIKKEKKNIIDDEDFTLEEIDDEKDEEEYVKKVETKKKKNKRGVIKEEIVEEEDENGKKKLIKRVIYKKITRKYKKSKKSNKGSKDKQFRISTGLTYINLIDRYNLGNYCNHEGLLNLGVEYLIIKDFGIKANFGVNLFSFAEEVTSGFQTINDLNALFFEVMVSWHITPRKTLDFHLDAGLGIFNASYTYKADSLSVCENRNDTSIYLGFAGGLDWFITDMLTLGTNVRFAKTISNINSNGEYTNSKIEMDWFQWDIRIGLAF